MRTIDTSIYWEQARETESVDCWTVCDTFQSYILRILRSTTILYLSICGLPMVESLVLEIGYSWDEFHIPLTTIFAQSYSNISMLILIHTSGLIWCRSAQLGVNHGVPVTDTTSHVCWNSMLVPVDYIFWSQRTSVTVFGRSVGTKVVYAEQNIGVWMDYIIIANMKSYQQVMNLCAAAFAWKMAQGDSKGSSKYSDRSEYCKVEYIMFDSLEDSSNEWGFYYFWYRHFKLTGLRIYFCFFRMDNIKSIRNE